METFKKILRPSQQKLKKIVTEYLKARDYKPVVGDGFVYAKGTIPIMLVAHLDTVHKDRPKDIYYDQEQDVMWSPQGIGGDDRCGVYAILKILETHKPYVCFMEDEEIGCVGAKKFVDTILQPVNVKYVIEIDRRGKDDCVFYDCGNEEFQKYIEGFDFHSQWGTFSDICEISDAWEIASVNLSSGYYKEHTLQEIIKFKELNDTIEKVKKLLDDANNVEYFDYQPVIYSGNYDYGYDYGYQEPKDYTPKTTKNEDTKKYLTKVDENVYYNPETGELIEVPSEEEENDKLE